MKFNRLVYLSNNLFIHIVYRKFLRHPEVTDLETNVNVGSGFGLARTTDPLTQIFRVLRYMNWKFSPFRKSFSLLDLGCGDGFMLKAFDFAGFRNLSGVEIDNELADLSRKNVPRASIASLDFSSSDFVQFAKKATSKQFLHSIQLLLHNSYLPYALWRKNLTYFSFEIQFLQLK